MDTASRRILSFDQIAALDDGEREYLDVPEWGPGVGVYVRSITAREREVLLKGEIRMANKSKTSTIDVPSMRVRICAMAICDEAGNSPFNNPKGVEVIGKRNPKAIQRISNVAMRLADIQNDLEDDEADGEDANPLSETTSADSSTA